MRDHPRAQVVHPSGDLIDVDEDLVPLLNGMWRRGIVTTNSCQDEDGRIWVEFASQRDVESFLLTLFRNDEDGEDIDSFRNRVFGTWRPPDTEEEDVANVRWWWWWDVDVMDMNRGEGPVRVELYHSVRFPIADLDEVARRLGRGQETRVVEVSRG